MELHVTSLLRCREGGGAGSWSVPRNLRKGTVTGARQGVPALQRRGWGVLAIF